MRPTVQCPSGIAPYQTRCGSCYGNLAWVAASFAVLALARPTPLGAAFLVAQALAVMVLALMEWRGLAALRPQAAE